MDGLSMTDNTTGFTADEQKAMREQGKTEKNKDYQIAAEADVMVKIKHMSDRGSHDRANQKGN
jgi:hypothetical protein